MKFLVTVSALFASAMALPHAPPVAGAAPGLVARQQSPFCNPFQPFALCCDYPVNVPVGYNCTIPTPTPSNSAQFAAACGSKTPKCCVAHYPDQGVYCIGTNTI